MAEHEHNDKFKKHPHPVKGSCLNTPTSILYLFAMNSFVCHEFCGRFAYANEMIQPQLNLLDLF